MTFDLRGLGEKLLKQRKLQGWGLYSSLFMGQRTKKEGQCAWWGWELVMSDGGTGLGAGEVAGWGAGGMSWAQRVGTSWSLGGSS